MESVPRQRWTEEEDQILLQLYQRNASYEDYTRTLPHKSRKQCCTRYNNYLNPNIVSGKLTKRHIKKINKLHGIYKNQWSVIAKILSISPNRIKNYWHCQQRKKIRSSPQNDDMESYSDEYHDKPLNFDMLCEVADEKYNNNFNDESQKKYSQDEMLNFNILCYAAEIDYYNMSLYSQRSIYSTNDCMSSRSRKNDDVIQFDFANKNLIHIYPINDF